MLQITVPTINKIMFMCKANINPIMNARRNLKNLKYLFAVLFGLTNAPSKDNLYNPNRIPIVLLIST
jgi:hypothetical protein